MSAASAPLALAEALREAALAYAARAWPVFPCVVGGKTPMTSHGVHDATTDPAVIARWWAACPRANLGVATGQAAGLFVLDIDPRHGGAEALTELEANHGPLPETPRCITPGGGVHFYFKAPAGLTIPCSAGKLAPGLDIRGDGGYVVAPPSERADGSYRWDAGAHPDDVELAEVPAWLLELILQPTGGKGHRSAEPLPELILEGARNATMASLAGSLRRRGASETAIVAALLAENQARCKPPLDEAEVMRIAGSVARYATGTPGRPAPNEPPWPAPLDEAAFHGIVGEMTRAIASVSEGSPVAILSNLLVAFGNVIGPGAHVRVGHDRHPARLFVVHVGATSKGRKRTSWSEPRELAIRAGGLGWDKRVREGGLSSGEGVIYALRDPVYKRVQDKKTFDWDEVCVDGGESDKRLLVVEEEFSSALAVMRREGNILSPILRQAWDSGNLAPMTKTNPIRATGAHISIVGHVSRDELRARIDDTALLNGFANRFLWLAVRRENVLPEGGGLAESDLIHWSQEFAQAARFGEKAGELRRDAEASDLWATVYGPLSEGKPGLLGAAIARGEAQVLRLSLLYALLDCSSVIRADHLLAALALWRYAEDSARWVFGDALGNAAADTILEALRRSGPLTRNAIVDLFGRHVNRAGIDLALGLLLAQGKARVEHRETGGRPSEVWHAT